jgi:hypothetical protein
MRREPRFDLGNLGVDIREGDGDVQRARLGARYNPKLEPCG